MSLNYFNEKEKVRKRQPHKRKAEKVVKKESLKAVYEKFIDFKIKQNLRPNTLNKFVVTFNSLEKFHETTSDLPLYLSDITTEFISDYVYWLKNEYVKNDGHKYKPRSAQTVGLSDASIETRLNNLKTFIAWCMKEELLQKNPFDKFEGFKKDEHTIDILTREELNRLLKVAKEHSKKSFKHFRDYCLLHVLVDCMFRITEALLLAPSDIDHVNRTLIIRPSNSKSCKARIVPLSNKTYRLLVQLLEENKAFEGEVDDLIFLSLSGCMLNKNNVLRDLRKYTEEAGITKRFYLHLIRNSAATHYLESGDIESLRKILGHRNLRTVLIYAHMADNTVVEKHSEHGFFGTNNMVSRKRNNKRK
ncbi:MULTISPECIES: tyrosine-type recombinase/integrase [Bacillus]|uniref:tyrosine-type recombinase/integrase n=1 Tax=Bacillus TaxID=1386 RepID=UPI0006FB7E97|nr:tyrosine-type recombinase/integrase [Bacillus altitudinis]KQL47790.1 integrase [Bacillus sp. FJAT-21955]MBU8652404.1 tyrosine-type recombinase/integrase [Bacillus altitudinis]MBU8780212.1 tyrosine-type recombinase/integrase [Bacillus altitudinis]NMF16189.1 tyrosine-type recombinase/integrase [Bacillus altitudinis]WOI42481.1 tyrosine-type recombinase/integrase [Bacillus altitudinis]